MIKLHIKQGKYTEEALFKDATLLIKPNTINIIKGSNGCGKTTLLNLLLGLSNNGFNCDFIFEYNQVKHTNKISEHFIKDSAFLFQNIPQLLNQFYKIYQQINVKDIKPQLITLFQLPNFNNYPNQYSSGELNKILLSLILSQNKSYIVLDEPTTHLDYQAIKNLAEYLLSNNRTFIITTHNQDLISLLIKKQPHISILEIDNRQIKTIEPRNMVNFSTQISLDKNTTPIIALTNYHIDINKQTIINNLTWHIYNEQINIITGSNGVGKTTLALSIYHKLINYKKICYYTSNNAIFINHNYPSLNSTSYVSGNYYDSMDLNFSIFSMAQDILTSNFNTLTKFAQYKIILNNLKILGLSKNILQKKLNTLSGGLRQKIALYFALLTKPKILILDEITSSMDNKTNEEMINILQYLMVRYKITIILITHNNKLINHFNNNIINIDNKNINNII